MAPGSVPVVATWAGILACSYSNAVTEAVMFKAMDNIEKPDAAATDEPSGD